jgi:hypothetical protein
MFAHHLILLSNEALQTWIPKKNRGSRAIPECISLKPKTTKCLIAEPRILIPIQVAEVQ